MAAGFRYRDRPAEHQLLAQEISKTHLKFRIVKEQLARHDIILTRTPYGEFRVNFRGGQEATAAYESDLQAAYDTGLRMIQEGKQ
jgi:hypothetical protein